ncbi:MULTISPECIES: phage tail tip lysozyme [Fructobacillus]|uniref:phage tail tip lysozyme n=1 Tax=Fructobacillus TaxID=559173 RepID=UPI00065D57E8|nr:MULTISPECIES: phage tail tip lysozyme [Fructobacillus]KMK52958.1 N-acetylmuramoyl-L-alanine amidase domain-containing protein precursor [Fructobacillus sp. EFB-N1]MCK8628043.1 phage tail-type lysozyme domain-containing protein [Fructobacillus cardui]CAK1253943.1 Surface antigen [Fructobacillus cardui]
MDSELVKKLQKQAQRIQKHVKRLKRAQTAGSFMIANAWLFVPLILLGVILLVIIATGVSSSNSSCNSANISVTSTADQKAMAKSIHDNLKNQTGFTEAGIAAYLGNSQVESSLNPSAIQGGKSYDESKANDKSVAGYAFGFNQWDSGRRVSLLKEAQSQGKDWKDPSFQLDFALNHDGKDSEVLKQGLKMNSVEEATEFLRSRWERGGSGTTAQRTSYAKKWYQEFSSGSDSEATIASVDVASSSPAPAISGCDTSTTKGTSGAPVKEIPSQYKDKITNQNFTATDSSNTYPFGECTWYTYNRMSELGHPVPNYLQNGGQWAQTAKAKGLTTSDKPSVGWAVSFQPGVAGAVAVYGHVAVVEAVSDDGKKFLVSEANVVDLGTGTVSFREITLGQGMTFIQGS